MTSRQALAVSLRYGARLDAYASRVSAGLVPHFHTLGYGDVYRAIAEQERTHAAVQADLASVLDAEGATSVPTEFAPRVYEYAATGDAIHDLLVLNIFERWSVWHFRLLARRSRQLGYRSCADALAGIGEDEMTHVRIGTEFLRSHGRIDPVVIAQTGRGLEDIQAVDTTVLTTIPTALGFARGPAGWCLRAASELINALEEAA